MSDDNSKKPLPADQTTTTTDSAKDPEKEKKKKAKEELRAAKEAKFKAKQEAAAKAKQQQSGSTDKEKKKKSKANEEEEEKELPFVNTTPAGEKKDMSQKMRKSYEPTAVEAAWYSWWLKQGYFTPKANNNNNNNNKSSEDKFVIVLPPPNVTGSLHLGHALTDAIQDAIVRWNRMCGKQTLWVPGTDHAGIATQTVVEKKLLREKGITRKELGREQFVAEVWKWKNEYGGKILDQLKQMGLSLDWSREVFTMDEKLSRAVTEAFIRMFESGLIYRDTRLVNWCCALNSAISDLEVDHKTLEKHTKMKVPGHGDKEYDFGMLIEFAYKVDGSDEELVVATTRPETMLGDTAVAVHPDDPRYKHLHGKLLVHPFVDRKIPIITDSELVKMDFGTGAVKVTPAHDPNDYACGKRHNLPFITILNENGTLNANAGQFQGLKRFDARDAVIQAFKDKNLYRGMKDNPMTIGICSRSKDIIEPLIKPQWWVNCKTMAEAATKAVREGELEIIPPEHKNTWFRWLDNIHDWCISRQLWWGHRVPAYLVCIEGQSEDWASPNNWVVGRTEEEAMRNARAKFPNTPAEKLQLKQDPDVLDTWFSSGLFPFSVMGWPDDTPDLRTFYPGSLLETGHDILFFWVARMVMMGIQLTGKLPFKQVYLHAMVRDAHGRKMSKSLGNVIDPLDMIHGITLEGLHDQLLKGNLDPRELEKATAGQKADFPNGIPECGTDALRFALCAYTTQGRDINLDVKRVAAYRNFCNKLWNVLKFALMNFGSDFQPAAQEPISGQSAQEKWILSRLTNAEQLSNSGFKVYDFAQTTTSLYSFWLYELCDVFLETLKPIMQGDSQDAKNSAKETLYTCLDRGLRLLHPFMPFVTEELWQRLPRRKSMTCESICIAPYPQPIAERANPKVEAELKFVQDVIHAARVLRARFGLTKERPQLFINLHSEEYFNFINSSYKQSIAFLSQSASLTPLLNQAAPEGCAVEIVNESCEIYLMIKGLVDIAAEIEKLEKKKEKLVSDIDKIVKQTQNAHYHKVPQKVKEENTAKMETLQQEVTTAENTIASYKKFLQ